MKVCSIASGSSGNCIYVGTEKTNILIDAGISRKRIVEGLHSIGVEPEQLDGIFVTHEHSDHIQGIPMMAKQFEVPIYATGGTLDQICEKDKKNVIKNKKRHPFCFLKKNNNNFIKKNFKKFLIDFYFKYIIF